MLAHEHEPDIEECVLLYTDMRAVGPGLRRLRGPLPGPGRHPPRARPAGQDPGGSRHRRPDPVGRGLPHRAAREARGRHGGAVDRGPAGPGLARTGGDPGRRAGRAGLLPAPRSRERAGRDCPARESTWPAAPGRRPSFPNAWPRAGPRPPRRRSTCWTTARKPSERRPAETRDPGGEPRVGVFVCHCGANIAGVVDPVQPGRRGRARCRAWSTPPTTASPARTFPSGPSRRPSTNTG